MTDPADGEVIEIAGDVVRLWRRAGLDRVLDRVVPLGEFLEALVAAAGPQRRDDLPLLPATTRLIHRRGPSTALIIERAPQVRRLSWSPKSLKGDGAYAPHALAFPYVVHLLLFYSGSLEEMRVYYRPRPLSAEEDRLYMPNLWNVQAAESPLAKCRACLRGRPELEHLDMAGQAEEVMEFFWGAGFNMDIEDNCFERARALDPRVSTLEAWAAATAADPLFVLEVPWEDAGVGARQAAEHLADWKGSGRRIRSAADLVDLLYRIRERREGWFTDMPH